MASLTTLSLISCDTIAHKPRGSHAADERLDRLVALKLLAPGLAADEEFRRRFLREARAAAAVDDPHIIPVYEAGEAGGVLFLAMRLVSGGDVRGLLRREGPLPAARTAAAGVAMSRAAAHGGCGVGPGAGQSAG